MIPVSVSDILKILDQIPIWKAVRDLPKRVAELERQVAELQAKAGEAKKPSLPEAKICPICGSEMKVVSETEHPQFGFGGVKVHAMKCATCGHETKRDYQPGKGYV